MKTKLNMTKAHMHLQILRHNNATINTKNIARLVGLYDIEPGDRYKLLLLAWCLHWAQKICKVL